MKTILPFGIFWILFAVAAQVKGQAADTAAARIEVDSLIQLNQRLVKQKKFEEALRIIGQAEEKCKAAFGEENALYATCLAFQGDLYYAQRKLSDAESFWLKAKWIREKVLGNEHLDYAKILDNLGRLYMDMGNYKKAEPLLQEVIAIRGKALSKEHIEYTNSLNNLARLYWKTQDYRKAESLILEIISAQEKSLGKEDPDYARSLFQLAIIYTDAGDYEKAEPLYLKICAIQEKVQGKSTLAYASTLQSMAIMYSGMRNVEKAESLYLEAKHIIENVVGKENIYYANILKNLALLYTGMGKLEKAEANMVESKSAQEKVQGKEHLRYYYDLRVLANLYSSMGNYDKAELLLLEAKAIQENTRGRDYGGVLNDLGILYYNVYNYEKAIPLVLEAKAIFEKVSDKENNDYVSSLSNLAGLYSSIRDYEKAELLHLEARDLREKILGKEHPDYLTSLNNLAVFYLETGQYEKVESLHLEAKAMREKVLGREHPDYTKSLNNLGNFYIKMGRFKEAKLLHEEAEAIREKTLGKEHPVYLNSLSALAVVNWKMEDYDAAESFYGELSKANYTIIAKAVRHLSEQELEDYLKAFLNRQAQMLSFAQTTNGISRSILHSCYNNSLYYKGFVLNAASNLKRLTQHDPVSVEQFNRLKSYGRRLAVEYAKPVSERDSSFISDLQLKANTLEKNLIRSVANFGEAQRQVSSQEVWHALQSGEAAIEFVHFQFSDPEPIDSTLYAALVLLPSDTAPHYIPLFEQTQLSTLLSKTQNSAQSVGNLYAAARTGIVLDEIPAYGTELYNLIWKPLDSLLRGVKTVYFSPSGLLHRVNLAAIPVDSTHVLADRYTLRQMSSTRNLVVKTPEPVPAGYTAALFGGIRYNTDSTALSNTALVSRGSETPASRSTLEYTADAQRDTAKAWNYLEGTRAEVDSLQRQMQRNGLNVKTFTGLAATEESLKALGRDTVKSPDILHIATHGFFFDDPEKRREQRFGDENVFRWNENPLFRSGLIMAGADHAWQTGRPYANLEDGICTAYEISHLNLSNTKLAVLSACETGLGDIKGSEGVYGLQRAFKMAGVDYLIVSLWKVPDAQTVEFMDAFYRNWLGGETIHEAFAKAQQMMRQKYGVYEWGAWVLIE